MKYGVADPSPETQKSDGAGDADLDPRVEEEKKSKTQQGKEKKRRAKAPIVVEHVDIIKDEFWERRPWLLSDKPGKVSSKPI